MPLMARNISSLVIDSLCDRAEEENIAVAGLYCDFLSQQEQTTTNIMGAILKQLSSRGGIPGHLREAFQKGKKEFGGSAPRLAALRGMLKIVIASPGFSSVSTPWTNVYRSTFQIFSSR